MTKQLNEAETKLFKRVYAKYLRMIVPKKKKNIIKVRLYKSKEIFQISV